MSNLGYLSRRSRKTNSSRSKSNTKGLRKKVQPPWDNTITNLLVYKPTKKELKRRHDIHKPIVRSPEDTVVTPQGNSSRLKTPDSSIDRGSSMLKEIMNTSEKLQEVLTYSDRNLSSIPDVFGDQPMKYRGFPSITHAPDRSESSLKPAFMKEPSVGVSSLDILSESVMDGTALNDISTFPQGKGCNITSLSSENQLKLSQIQFDEGEDCKDCEDKTRDSTEISDERQENVKRRPNCKQNNSFPESYNIGQMVHHLEEEVKLFEIETGRQETSLFVAKEKGSFGGFTASILQALTKLVGYLRESELERNIEKTPKRQDIMIAVQQQQILIDALTHEMICLQDENRKLNEKMENNWRKTDNEIKTIKHLLYSLLKDNGKDELSFNETEFLTEKETSQILDRKKTNDDIIDHETDSTANSSYEESARKSVDKCEHHAIHVANPDNCNDIVEIADERFESCPTSSNITTSIGDNTVRSNTETPPYIETSHQNSRLSQENTRNRMSVTMGANDGTISRLHPVHVETNERNEDVPGNYSQLRHSTNDTSSNNVIATSPGVFTYNSPLQTSFVTIENPSQLYRNDFNHSSVYIGRNHMTSPRRHDNTKLEDERLNCADMSDRLPKKSPQISSLIQFDKPLISQKSDRKDSVRMASILQGKRVGPENLSTSRRLSQIKDSQNGWFALSSHVTH